MNSSRPVIPEELNSNLLRDPSIQVQFITLRNFLKEMLYLEFLNLYFCTGWVWVFWVVYCNFYLFFSCCVLCLNWWVCMYQLSLFQLRERGLVELLTAQVMNLVKQGVSMTDATISVPFYSKFNTHPIVCWIFLHFYDICEWFSDAETLWKFSVRSVTILCGLTFCKFILYFWKWICGLRMGGWVGL